MIYYDKLIFELSAPGRKGYTLPVNKYPRHASVPDGLRRADAPALPQVSEPDVVRHYTNLSQMNFGVDTGFYPLGSCTMKYNPKLNEEIAALPAFTGLHPLQPVASVQGALEVYWEMEQALRALTGLEAFTFNPCAGAHGELTGLMVMKRYHELRGDTARVKIIVPDSAHGTNPASAAVCGFEVVEVKSLPNGRIDVSALKELLGPDVAGIMMTNPNTLGLFETEIKTIAALVHEAGGLLYYDGANMNPLMGVVRPGDMGFDIMHLNLHKTFSTPHGGGGPGSGPVGVAAHLVQCLPLPRVVKSSDGHLALVGAGDSAERAVSPARTTGASAGRVSGFLGNFGVILRALAYIKMLGRQNVRRVGEFSTLGANYIKECLKDVYKLPIEGVCKHEFVFDGLVNDGARPASCDGSNPASDTPAVAGATTLDVAKRLLDYGFHAPTIYFPLLFHQALMIEPTETESKETLDRFIAVMRQIAAEAAADPALLHEAPHNTPVRRPDETQAARNPVLKY